MFKVINIGKIKLLNIDIVCNKLRGYDGYHFITY